MSVEINRGDIVTINNLPCSVLYHRILDEDIFSVRENIIDIPTPVTVTLVHKDDDFGNGYILAEWADPYHRRANIVYLINLYDVKTNAFTLLNGTKLLEEDEYPNKWAEFIDADKRKIPEALINSACPSFTKYERLIKKYVPLRRRLYLWVCTKWCNLVG